MFTNGTFSHHEYNLKDHLGNTRVVVSPDENSDGKAEISQTAHYYPFGMNFQRPTDNHNRRLYNGKELQTELDIDWYDYGARFYDPAIGKFTTVDPHAEEYFFQSPYVYAVNNPIRFIDWMGMSASPIYDMDGNFLGTDDQGIQGEAIIMEKDNFEQGMTHDGALALGYTLEDDNLPEYALTNFVVNSWEHYRTLDQRPDWDGFVTIEEGIDWAKSHPGALDNPTPDNTLYFRRF